MRGYEPEGDGRIDSTRRLDEMACAKIGKFKYLTLTQFKTWTECSSTSIVTAPQQHQVRLQSVQIPVATYVTFPTISA